MARTQGRAETIDFLKQDVYETLQEMTSGRGPDRCIDAVGAEAHGTGGVDAVVDKLKAAVKLTTDRPHALRQAIYCCRKAGTVSVPGVYIGFPDKFPMGAFMNKGLTMKTGQTHMHRYMRPATRTHRSRSDRPVLRDHPPHPARASARGLQNVPRQGRRLHQGRAQAVAGAHAQQASVEP